MSDTVSFFAVLQLKEKKNQEKHLIFPVLIGFSRRAGCDKPVGRATYVLLSHQKKEKKETKQQAIINVFVATVEFVATT